MAGSELHVAHDFELRLNGRTCSAVTAGRKWYERPDRASCFARGANRGGAKFSRALLTDAKCRAFGSAKLPCREPKL
jgi:hypothetical protein